MLITLPGALSPDQIVALRDLLDGPDAAWVDGRTTAGWQGAPVKLNQQIDEASETARRAQHLVLSVLERDPRFISAALPNVVYPPLFNRYGEGMYFGPHVDGGVRLDPRNGAKLRTDISATLFLTDPADYDGGELQIEDSFGRRGVKLAAGDLVLYPATSVHEVTPVTRGARTACFFWVQSLVRDDALRALLHDMDGAIQRLTAEDADAAARRTLVGCYHNLLRQWAET
jgi:PKHD-type hydroxylase